MTNAQLSPQKAFSLKLTGNQVRVTKKVPHPMTISWREILEKNS